MMDLQPLFFRSDANYAVCQRHDIVEEESGAPTTEVAILVAAGYVICVCRFRVQNN